MKVTEEYIQIPKYETASLWMLTVPRANEPRVVSFHCPACRDPDNSRLIHINLPTEPRYPLQGSARRKSKQPYRTLLHVTRAQIEQILEDFGKKGNFGTFEAILRHKDDSSDE